MIHSSDPLYQAVALILARELKSELFLCHAFFKSAQVEKLRADHRVDLLLQNDSWEEPGQITSLADTTPADNEGCLYVFTSGTTGEPKIARHRWATIQYSSEYVSERLSGRTWIMTYSATSFAGLQVFFSAINSDGTIYYPPAEYDKMAAGMSNHGVTIISGTPTFWRMLISSWPSDVPSVKLEQATLGGEIVDQAILDSIKSFFAPTRLTHIYASTEAGTAIVVSDGRAGFPIEYLDRQEGVQLQVVDGLLQVKTPAPMSGYVDGRSISTDDGWLRTDDAVEMRDGRVYFVGRQDGMINVGGLKVLPEEVELALQSLPQVTDSRVFAKRSPILGSIVAAEIVMQNDTKLNAKEIKSKLRAILADYKVPQVFLPVSKIEATPHGKKSRR